MRNDDQDRMNRHSFRRPPPPVHHDGMGLGSSGVGSDTLRQLEQMRDTSDLLLPQKKKRHKEKVSKSSSIKVSRRIIKEDESSINSKKRKHPQLKNVMTRMEHGHERHCHERQGQDRHDRLKKSVPKKSIKIVGSKRESALPKKKTITKNPTCDDSDGVHEKPRRRRNDVGDVKKHKPKRKKFMIVIMRKRKIPNPREAELMTKQRMQRKKKINDIMCWKMLNFGTVVFCLF